MKDKGYKVVARVRNPSPELFDILADSQDDEYIVSKDRAAVTTTLRRIGSSDRIDYFDPLWEAKAMLTRRSQGNIPLRPAFYDIPSALLAHSMPGNVTLGLDAKEIDCGDLQFQVIAGVKGGKLRPYRQGIVTLLGRQHSIANFFGHNLSRLGLSKEAGGHVLNIDRVRIRPYINSETERGVAAAYGEVLLRGLDVDIVEGPPPEVPGFLETWQPALEALWGRVACQGCMELHFALPSTPPPTNVEPVEPQGSYNNPETRL